MVRRKLQFRKNLDSLFPEQLAKHADSLEVLKLMRHGLSLSKASKQVGISPNTVRKYIGSALYKKHNRLIAKKSDNLLRKVPIYKNCGEISITIKGNRQATLVGQYHSAIGRLPHDRSALLPFKKIKIKDSYGKTHTLETNTVKILAILERREDAEFFSIYSR